MAYSTATFQAVSILLYIHFKTEDEMYDFLSTRSISEMLNIPTPTAVKVLNKLNAAGLTITKEGARGGNLLAKPISKMTLLEVFIAIEQDKPLFKTQQNFNFEYEHLEAIRQKTLQSLGNAETAMKESLKSVLLIDLIK